MKTSPRDALALGLALVAAWLAHRFVLQLELLGWDSFPLIAASRAGDLGELVRGLGEELMDGRYPRGRFYRPLTGLSFAFDHALWGLDPLGYQLTNLTLLLACVVGVYALARRWLGGWWPAGVAAGVFAVHPALLETVPVAARRGDLLATAFVLAALVCQPLGARASGAALAGGALFAGLAVASKETGVVALPVIAAAQALLGEGAGGPERIRRTLLRSLPAAGAVAVLIAARWAVLGGWGGHPGSSALGPLAGLLDAPDTVRALLMPQPWTLRPALDAGLTLLLTAALVAAIGLGGAAGSRAARSVPALCAAWLLCLLALTGLSGDRASWYTVPFLAPYALLLGCVAEIARAAVRLAPRRAGWLAAAVATLLAASHVAYSGLFRAYPEWSELSRQQHAFLERFRSAVETAEPGTTVSVPELPLGTGAPWERVGIRSALGLADYSVEAYAELLWPGRAVRVVLHRGGPPSPPTPDAVTVDAIPLPSPVLAPPPGARG